jgi:hypothetical protein
MPENRTKIRLFDRDVDVVEVPITVRQGEVPSQYELEDGSTIRFSVVATVVYRIDGQWDADGNPIYLVKTGQSVTVVKASENVRRPTTN